MNDSPPGKSLMGPLAPVGANGMLVLHLSSHLGLLGGEEESGVCEEGREEACQLSEGWTIRAQLSPLFQLSETLCFSPIQSLHL